MSPQHSSIQSRFPKPIYLGGVTRSPIGKFGGSLKRFSAPELASLTLTEARKRSEAVGDDVDWVFLGHARQAGAGPNPARQAAIASGLPESVPALTLNQACASGMTAIFSGVEKIALGQAKSIWSGGVESMSNTPYMMMDARWGQRMGHAEILDGMYRDGFFCPMSQMVMGETVENFIAKEFKISREEQDQFALQSQKRAEEAWSSGAFASEVFEIPEGGRRQPGLYADEHRRPQTTIEGLAKLKPVFDPEAGSVTAGNSSGITDGSAFVHLGLERMGHHQVEVLDYATTALDPKRMGLGPISAIREILDRNSLTLDEIDSLEINEAFAAQVIACQRELQIPSDKLNRRGGAIAIGHPIGATGARIVTTLVHQLKGKKGALGIASLCVSGGMGTAILIRSLD